MLRKAALLFAGVLFLGGGLGRADEAVLDQLYGDGVHAYFSSDATTAFNALTTAIQSGSHDPRVYYFRALAEMRLGRQDDAGADLQKGAALEAADVNGRFIVSQALERIQGQPRAAIEQYRENARSVAVQHEMRQKQGIYDQARPNETTVLRRELPPAEVMPAPAPQKPAVAADATAPAEKPVEGVDPFAGGAAKPADKPAVAPADAAAPAAEAKPAAKAGDAPVADPFGTGTAPADKPAATPAEKPADKSADAPAADPFGANPKPADAKPAEAPADKPAEKPADKAAEKPADANDPFGAGAKPADKPAAAPMPDVKPPADAKSADAGATVKPQPGALGGVFRALAGAVPGGDDAAAKPAIPGKAIAMPPAAVGPTPVNPPANAKPAEPDAGANPLIQPPPGVDKPAAPADAGKAKDNPFGDDPGPAAKGAPAAGKAAAPEMKKDDDPFGK